MIVKAGFSDIKGLIHAPFLPVILGMAGPSNLVTRVGDFAVRSVLPFTDH